MAMKQDLINHIELSLKKTDIYNSKINREILEIDGMSGKKTRHFYNNICSMDGTRYLEIGTWKGSSICSAMCNNSMTCTAIDNWSQYGGAAFGWPNIQFATNFNKFKGKNNATFIEQDCWNVDVSTIGKFNVYMYDGAHGETSHFQAINHYLDCLDDEFIYLIDDWNWERVRNGTMKSIKQNNLKILYQKEIRTTSDNSHGEPRGQNSDWHNGISIFVLKK